MPHNYLRVVSALFRPVFSVHVSSSSLEQLDHPYISFSSEHEVYVHGFYDGHLSRTPKDLFLHQGKLTLDRGGTSMDTMRCTHCTAVDTESGREFTFMLCL